MDRGFAMTSDEAFDLAEVPESLVIVGGGAIGVEMATAWRDCELAKAARPVN